MGTVQQPLNENPEPEPKEIQSKTSNRWTAAVLWAYSGVVLAFLLAAILAVTLPAPLSVWILNVNFLAGTIPATTLVFGVYLGRSNAPLPSVLLFPFVVLLLAALLVCVPVEHFLKKNLLLVVACSFLSAVVGISVGITSQHICKRRLTKHHPPLIALMCKEQKKYRQP